VVVRRTKTGKTDKSTAVELLRAQRRATLALLSSLDPPAWERACLPPWCVRHVVAHLITIDEAAATGRLLPLLRAANGRDEVEAWNDVVVAERARADPATLLEALDRAGERLAAVIAKVPAVLWKLPVRTVFGRHPLGFLTRRRLLDEWVHSVDIARATDRPWELPVVIAPALADAVLEAAPALILPKVEASAGVIRFVVLVGELGEDAEHTPRRTWSVDLARRQYGPRVTARPDATVRLHVAALALLAEGRPLPDGHLQPNIDGEPEVAASLLEVMSAAVR
jgi:uncharacterized protein (TIGR03083 family)